MLAARQGRDEQGASLQSQFGVQGESGACRDRRGRGLSRRVSIAMEAYFLCEAPEEAFARYGRIPIGLCASSMTLRTAM